MATTSSSSPCSLDAKELISSVLADFLCEGSYSENPDIHLQWIKWKEHYLSISQSENEDQEEKAKIAAAIYQEKFGRNKEIEKKFRLETPETEDDLSFFDDFIKDLELLMEKC